MKTKIRRKHTGMSKESGLSLMEMLIVLVIIGVLAAVGTTYIGNMRDKQTVATGIQRVYMLKKAMEQMARECKGWPERTSATDWALMQKIMNRYGANNYPGGAGAPAKIPTYPKDSGCDWVSLQNLLPSGLFIPTCVVGDASCSNLRNQKHIFNEVFVTDTQANACPDPSGGAMPLGWNYVLLTNQTSLRNLNAPVPVYCGNVTYKNTSVTVVVNGGGFVDDNNKVSDGAGMYDYSGSKLAGACPCGAWCRKNDTGEQGCCNECTDNGSLVSGIGYKY